MGRVAACAPVCDRLFGVELGQFARINIESVYEGIRRLRGPARDAAAEHSSRPPKGWLPSALAYQLPNLCKDVRRS